ncbi:MAG TPA: HAD family phosphatase [Candidatus Saccharimonadales bacterium]|nr:HAD family phosphatase [Candidatus Saccharimonadales bacterium]
MSYKAILFDMDGVIVSTEPVHLAAFQATLGRMGHDLTEQDYLQHFAGRTDEDGFKQYFAFMNEEVDIPVVMDEKAKEYMRLATDQLVPYPGIIDFIREVSQRVPIALVTGSLRDEAETVLDELKIADCFTTVITANEVEHGKPNPEGYLKAAKTLGVEPADCVIIEDSPSGVKAANAAGIRSLAVLNTHSAEDLAHATAQTEQLSLVELDSI